MEMDFVLSNHDGRIEAFDLVNFDYSTSSTDVIC